MQPCSEEDFPSRRLRGGKILLCAHSDGGSEGQYACLYDQTQTETAKKRRDRKGFAGGLGQDQSEDLNRSWWMAQRAVALSSPIASALNNPNWNQKDGSEKISSITQDPHNLERARSLDVQRGRVQSPSNRPDHHLRRDGETKPHPRQIPNRSF